MIQLEYEIEKCLRSAIRANIDIAASAVPELATAKIIGFWLDSEDGSLEMQDSDGIHVMLMAHPNSAEGYNTSYNLEPQRTMQVDVSCVSQPDSDVSRLTCRSLYNAVRSVFETTPIPFTMPTGVSFGAAMITGQGSADIANLGQVTSFTVEMKLSIT